MESAARDERVNKAKETVLATRRCVHACCLSLCQQPTCHDESNLKGLERRQWTTNGLIEARLDLCGQHLTQAPLGNVRGLFCCSLTMPQHSKQGHTMILTRLALLYRIFHKHLHSALYKTFLFCFPKRQFRRLPVAIHGPLHRNFPHRKLFRRKRSSRMWTCRKSVH